MNDFDTNNDYILLGASVSEPTNVEVNERADAKIAAVIESWSDMPNWQKKIEALIRGGVHTGIKAGRLYQTSKVGLTAVHGTVDGWTGSLPKRRVDIPVEWLSKEYISAITHKIDWYSQSFKDHDPLPLKSLNGKGNNGKWLLKLMLLATNGTTRSEWSSRISTLITFPDYRIRCDSKGRVVAVVNYPAIIKEEHAIKGFYNTVMPDSVFAYKADDGGIFSMEEPKKASARVSRLVQHPDSIDMGVQTFFIAEDIPESLTDWFITGAGFTPSSMLGRIGGFRARNEYGLKMTSMLYPSDWEAELGGAFMVCKASFKSQLNGIAKLVSKCSDRKLMAAEDGPVGEYLEDMIQSVVLNGETVRGWYVEMPLGVTNMYSLYGLRNILEDDGIEDENSSYYVSSFNALNEDPSYDVLGDLSARLEENELHYVAQTVNVKMQELNVAYWSYGKDVADQYMKNIVAASKPLMRASTRFAWDVMSDSEVNAVVYDEEFFAWLSNDAYPASQSKNGRNVLLPGIIDPEMYLDCEYGQGAIDRLLYGVEGHVWDGLLGDSIKEFRLHGHSFIVPGGDVMGEFIHEEDGSERIFLSSVGKVLQMLIASYKNPNTNWEVKSINHDMDLQAALLGQNMDSFTVKGFGNKTMLPAPWLSMSQICVVDPIYSNMNGRTVSASKMPVLFNKAISGYKLRTNLPRSIFGEVDTRIELALKNMVFTNIDIMLDHQNDTDGDQLRVFLVDGLPLYYGLPVHMLSWRESYVTGEQDLAMKFKSYVHYDSSSISDATFEAMENKIYVGKATNALSLLGHILQMFVSSNKYEYYRAQCVRDAYSMGMQEDIVRGIKHSSGGLFKLANMYGVLYASTIIKEGESMSPRDKARKAFSSMVISYLDISYKEDVECFFKLWDEYSCSHTVDGYSPLSSRRVGDITSHSYELVEGENHMIELDMLTNSYISQSYSAQPSYAMSSSHSEEVKAGYECCMDNVDAYRSKYVIWDQVLPVHTDTMVGSVLAYWNLLSK